MKKLLALALVALLSSNAHALSITGNDLLLLVQAPDTLGGGLGGLLDVYTIVADNSVENGGSGTAITAFDLSFLWYISATHKMLRFRYQHSLRHSVLLMLAPFRSGSRRLKRHPLPASFDSAWSSDSSAPTEGVITVWSTW